MPLHSRYVFQCTWRILRTSELRPATFARFSQCARLRNEPPTSNTDRKPGPVKERQDGNTGKKARRLAVPALALFALSIPLGWYLKNQYAGDDQMRLAGPHEFVKYTLVGKDTVSSTCAIFRLMPAANMALDLDDPDCERAITSVQFKQPQLQIARAYTLLPQQQGQHMDEVRFLIRKEQKGEVSNFLHRLPINAEIEARGLHSEYVIPTDVKSVAFLAGGTGIAPALQAADILEGQADMHILWANRRREDCTGGHSDTATKSSTWSWWGRSATSAEADRKITHEQKGALVLLLEDLKKRAAVLNAPNSRLLVDYYVDEEGVFIKPQDVKKALGSVSQQENDDKPGRKILFVSGPEGFMNYWAGPKQWVAGREVQGPLRGVLSTMDLNGWEVVKL